MAVDETPTPTPTPTSTVEVSRSWQIVSFEVVAIVFSVLFALFVSEWWQAREEAENHRRVLVLLVAELETNRDEIRETIEYYTEMSEALGPILSEEEVEIEKLEAIEGCCTLRFGGEVRTAHEMAMLTGLYTALDPTISSDIVAPYIGYESVELLQEVNLAKMIETAGTGEPEANAMSYYVFAIDHTNVERHH